MYDRIHSSQDGACGAGVLAAGQRRDGGRYNEYSGNGTVVHMPVKRPAATLTGLQTAQKAAKTEVEQLPSNRAQEA